MGSGAIRRLERTRECFSSEELFWMGIAMHFVRGSDLFLDHCRGRDMGCSPPLRVTRQPKRGSSCRLGAGDFLLAPHNSPHAADIATPGQSVTSNSRRHPADSPDPDRFAQRQGRMSQMRGNCGATFSSASSSGRVHFREALFAPDAAGLLEGAINLSAVRRIRRH